MEPLQEAWSAGINWDDLPWFAVEKAREGAEHIRNILRM